ncbi:hypothetical protein M3Y94_01046300 [Aphelenchoides besseyi]|nr:hypothetical protein M3Y94_01046300 [Aphelenchoides besseyi]KAI6224041.1 hypothetical protein M3Y95_00841100 [Aphelenchoides besseyi]
MKQPTQRDVYTNVYEGIRYFLPFVLRMIFFWIHDSIRLISPIWPRKSINGQLMLITGSGSGIGRASALKFAEQGVRLILWDVNEDDNMETLRILELLGYTDDVVAMTVNLADPHAIEIAGREVIKEYGIPDLVFNNAGVVGGFDLFNCDLEKYEMTMAVNSRAVLYVNEG